MSSEAQVALIVGVITAAAGLIGALGGTAIGWYLTGKSAKRTEKRSAFVELLSSLDAIQHIALVLSSAVSRADAPELARQTDLMMAAIARVDNAVSIAALSVGDEHLETLRAAMTASIKEFELAVKGGPIKTVIPDAWNQILALAKKELG